MDELDLWWCEACACYHFDQDVEITQENGTIRVICLATRQPVFMSNTTTPTSVEESIPAHIAPFPRR